jgi:hypothetical protein
MRFRSSISSVICGILLFGAAAAAELPAPEYWMQEDLKDLPPALQRLVLFQPDPGQLMAFSTTSARTLYYRVASHVLSPGAAAASSTSGGLSASPITG